MSNRTKKSKNQPGNNGKKNGQHITRISAGSSRRPQSEQPTDQPQPELIVNNDGDTVERPVDPADEELNTPKELTRADKKTLKRDQRTDEERPVKSYFLLFRPFVTFGRYLRDSWREICQVRWPNRKATWKMTLAVLVYCALFMIFLTLIDVFFTFLFELIFKTQ